MDCKECGQEMRKGEYVDRAVYEYQEWLCGCGNSEVDKQIRDGADDHLVRLREEI